MATNLLKRFLINISRPYNNQRLSDLLHGRLAIGLHYDNRLKLFMCPSFEYCCKAVDCSREEPVEVPVDRLTVTYSRSSGPGGQHVNKVNTKVEVRFHVRTADWIPEEARFKILLKNKNRINKAGELLVTSEVSRNQQRNLGDCLRKISDIIVEANHKPRVPTAEDVAVRRVRLEKMNQERLKQKKFQSTTKRSRRVDFD